MHFPVQGFDELQRQNSGSSLRAIAIPHVAENWMNNSTDPGVRRAAETYFTKIDLLADKQAKSFEDGVLARV